MSFSACQLDEMYTNDDIIVHEVHTGDGDGAALILDLNGKRITISFFPSAGLPEGKVKSDQPPACIEDSIIQRLSRTLFAEPEKHEEIMDQVLLTISDIGKFVLEEVVQPTRSSPRLLSKIYTPCSTLQYLPFVLRPLGAHQP